MKEGDKMTNLNTFVGRIMLAIFGEGETHYINGAETLPPPLTPEKENEIRVFADIHEYFVLYTARGIGRKLNSAVGFVCIYRFDKSYCTD